MTTKSICLNTASVSAVSKHGHHRTEGGVQEGGRVWKSHFDPSFKSCRCFGGLESSGEANTSGTAVTRRTAVYGYSTDDSTFVKWKLCFQAEGSRTPCKHREKCHSSWGRKQLGARTWPAAPQSAHRAGLCFLTAPAFHSLWGCICCRREFGFQIVTVQQDNYESKSCFKQLEKFIQKPEQ